MLLTPCKVQDTFPQQRNAAATPRAQPCSRHTPQPGARLWGGRRAEHVHSGLGTSLSFVSGLPSLLSPPSPGGGQCPARWAPGEHPHGGAREKGGPLWPSGNWPEATPASLPATELSPRILHCCPLRRGLHWQEHLGQHEGRDGKIQGQPELGAHGEPGPHPGSNSNSTATLEAGPPCGAAEDISMVVTSLGSHGSPTRWEACILIYS